MTREEYDRAWTLFLARLRGGETVQQATRGLGVSQSASKYIWRRIRATILYAEGTR